MPRILADKNRDYKRKRHSAEEKNILADNGLQHVLSSNVSAVANIDENLIIRFHNSSIYSYTDRGHLVDDILRSASKGKWVHRHLRRRNAAFIKIGSLPLPSDLSISDDSLFKDIESQRISVEEPQVLGKKDVLTLKNLITVAVLDDILGVNMIPIKLI